MSKNKKSYYKKIENTPRKVDGDSFYSTLIKAEKNMRSKYYYDPEKPVIQLYKENLDKLKKANIKTGQIIDALKTLKLKYDYVVNYLFSNDKKEELQKLLDKDTKEKMKEIKYCRKRIRLELDGTEIYYLELFDICNGCCGHSEIRCPMCNIKLSNGSIEIENLETKKKIKFDKSLIHMIKEHDLFERTYDKKVDPYDLIEVLKLKPNKNYEEKRRKINILMTDMGDANFDDESDDKISWESFFIFNIFKEKNDMERFRKKIQKIYLGDPVDGNYICYFTDFEEVIYGWITKNEGDKNYTKKLYLIHNNSEKIVNKIYEIKIPELKKTYELYLEKIHLAWKKKGIMNMTTGVIYDVPVL